MNKIKTGMVVKGYLLKEKRNTILTSLFLCFITIFCLMGNQLFINVQLANKKNAESLEGKQHVTYYGIGEEEFEKIKDCSFVAETGQSFNLGRAEDGTTFSFIDQAFRDLSATVADKNIKQVIYGNWAEKEKEIVFTENYMTQYKLNLGDEISVDLSATDSDTGDQLFQLTDITFVIVGVIEDVTGFTDRKMAYVSEEFAQKVIKDTNGKVNVVVKFDQEARISEDFKKLNTLLGYDEEDVEIIARKNSMLITAVDDNGDLKYQNRIMNFIIWIVCVMVVYNIFYNRFFGKKKDFMILRKIGFQTRDLLKITITEFLIFVVIGAVSGIIAGYGINRITYGQIMKLLIDSYNGESLVSSDLSLHSVWNTFIMLFLVFIPSIIIAPLQLKNVEPVNIMRNKRKNTRKVSISLMIVILSAILISLLSIQDNDSDSGIIYVKTYVPGDMQIVCGNISDGMLENNAVSISDDSLHQVLENKNIAQVQSYEINYTAGVFICREESELNEDAPGYYEMLKEMTQQIDGKEQCLYSMTLAAADNMKALVPSYDEAQYDHAAILEQGLANALNLKIGDTFTIYGEELAGADSTKGVTSITFQLIETREDMVLSENHVGPNLMIIDSASAKLMPGSFSRQVVNIWVKDGRETDAAAGLKKLSELEGYSFHSAKQQMQEYIDTYRNQTIMHYFFLLLLALIGVLTYFNTIFSNILSRRNEFLLMHKIGIRKPEMYFMVFKEGTRNGILALAGITIVQLILCMINHISFPRAFIITDAGVIVSCMFFPVFIMYFMFHRYLCNKAIKNENLYKYK